MKTSAYLFVHFKGSQKTPDDEQIYFAVSRDGCRWRNLNNGKPILRSVLGEGGVRDPHIIRTEDNKFVIIATDLYIYGKWGETPDGWYRCQREGSKSLMVWKSDDLVNWSEQKMLEVGTPDAACVWAPECVYDDKSGDYLVYWSSRCGFDGCAKQRIYSAHTSDFESFTEPKIYIEREFSVIDTSILKFGGKYYRFTKNHDEASIYLEVSDSAEDEFKEIESFSMKGKSGYEGPTAYVMNDGETICMLIDAFASNGGYRPFITKDMASGDFKPQSGFETPDPFRHGTVLPITEEEYARLTKNYGL